MIVAIDGPAGAGKSAVGRRVSRALGLPFVDSGNYYRAVSHLAREEGIGSGDGPGLVAIASRPQLRVVGEQVFAGRRDLSELIHQPAINQNLSAVSQLAEVRDAINDRLRHLAEQGVVMVGRDIGTVVFPDTRHKFFLTAGLHERVRRRLAQKAKRGDSADAAEMEREIAARDVADSTRSVAPLRPAADAISIDTDGLDLDQVVASILELVRR